MSCSWLLQAASTHHRDPAPACTPALDASGTVHSPAETRVYSAHLQLYHILPITAVLPSTMDTLACTSQTPVLGLYACSLLSAPRRVPFHAGTCVAEFRVHRCVNARTTCLCLQPARRKSTACLLRAETDLKNAPRWFRIPSSHYAIRSGSG